MPHSGSTTAPSTDTASRALRALRVMRGVAHAQSRATTESELLATTCDELVKQGAFRLAWIGFAMDDEVRSVKPVAYAGVDREYFLGLDVRWSDDVRGRGPTGTAIRTGSVVVISDIPRQQSSQPWHAKAVEYGVASSIALPITSGTRCIGAINLCSADPDAFDGDEQALLAELAAMISQALAGVRARVEHEAAVTALRQSEERFRQIAENVSSVIYVLAGDYSRVLYVNRAIEPILGIPREEIYRDPSAFGRHIHPEDAKRLSALAAQSPQGYEIDYRIILPERGVRWLRVRAFPVRDEKGRTVRVAGIAEDITDSKASEEARRKLDAQAEQTRRLEGQSRLAAGIAHDFNNLLAVMLNHAAIARHALSEEHPAREDLRGIEDAIQQAVRLTRQLVLFSQRAEEPPERLDVNVVVDEMRRVLQSAAGEKATLSIALDEATPRITMVRSHLEQVLLNLVINAGEAMPEGGTVRIATAPAFFVRLEADPRESNVRAVRITVSDNGPGMTEEQRIHAFEPFYSSKEANGHTGLGLAIVYGAVEQAGGRVTLEDEDGGGTRAVILLPCS